MEMDNLDNVAIYEILCLLEWRERAVLTLRALEDFNTEEIAYCLDMPKVPVYYLSWRLSHAVRRLLEQNKYPWDTLDAFYHSFERLLDEEIGGC